MMQAVYGQLAEVIRIVAYSTSDLAKLVPIHARVVDAIAAGDPAAARLRMQDHFESIREDLLLAAKQISTEKERMK
jgi:DNA-binding FadR family transcriptional regulator